MTQIGRIGAEWRNHEQNEQAQTDANRCEGWTKLRSGGGALAVAGGGQVSRRAAEARRVEERVENTSLLRAWSHAARGAPETFPPRLAAQRSYLTRIGANWTNRRGMTEPRTERTGADRREQVREKRIHCVRVCWRLFVLFVVLISTAARGAPETFPPRLAAQSAFHANDANRANRRGMAEPRTERTGADRREQVREKRIHCVRVCWRLFVLFAVLISTAARGAPETFPPRSRGAETAFHANDANRRGMAKPRTERTGADRREQVGGMDEALEWRRRPRRRTEVVEWRRRPRRRTVVVVGRSHTEARRHGELRKDFSEAPPARRRFVIE